ncbi:MAG: hypothetical protein WA652_18245 [Xanthobacteraceae bacterium]
MDTNRTTAAKPTGSQKTSESQAFGEIAQKGAAQTKQTYERMSAATAEAADLMKASCSTALSGARDYNNKFMEFAHANTNAAFDLGVFHADLCVVLDRGQLGLCGSIAKLSYLQVGNAACASNICRLYP